MIKKFLVFITLACVAVMLYPLFESFESKTHLSKVGAHYAQNGIEEVGAANLVTAVVVTYRGFDTLGEVTILFLAATIIGMMLKRKKKITKKRKVRESSEILQTGANFLFPIIAIYGTYIFINGHLTPGGGFQGGAVIASGVLLLLLGDPNREISHNTLSIIESISGVSYVVIGVLGIILAGGFLDNRILDLGEFGTILSAGIIPVIYVFIGLKVGTELSNILVTLNEAQ